MAVVTLTTDWGIKDYYTAAVKGFILKSTGSVNIVDVTHSINAFDLVHASFVLQNTIPFYPDGTIHIVDVDAHGAIEEKYLLAITKNQFILGSDNGLFSLLKFDFEKFIEIKYAPGSFPALELLAPVACELIKGISVSEIGKEITTITQKMLLQPIAETSAIRGNVMYIDSYRNVIVNIKKEQFEKASAGRKCVIFLRRSDYNIEVLSNGYNNVPAGEKTAFFNSAGYLEIAINQGKAADLLGIKYNDMIRIEFRD